VRIGDYMEYTTILVSPETRDKLASFKSYKRESYDEVVKKLLELVPTGDDEGEYTDSFRIGLVNARLDLKHGKTIPHDVVKRRFGL